jgi:NAD(P)-dependent dehydrogenase (short-subunit alcohol dehydrogenase family)
MTANSIKGKKALIIGGSSGIGKATAMQLLKNGATVHIVSKDQVSVDAAIKELQLHGNISGERIDMTNKSHVQNLLLKLTKESVKINYLINASGILSEAFRTIILISITIWILTAASFTQRTQSRKKNGRG